MIAETSMFGCVLLHNKEKQLQTTTKNRYAVTKLSFMVIKVGSLFRTPSTSSFINLSGNTRLHDVLTGLWRIETSDN